MDRLRAAVAELSACLWDREVAAATTDKDARAAAEARYFLQSLLDQVKHETAARKLIRDNKSFDVDLTEDDIGNARRFLTRVFKVNRAETPKLTLVRRLSDRPLCILAILCCAEPVLESAKKVVYALLKGVATIAQCSKWPDDPRLQKLVREHRPQAESAIESCLLSATPQSPSNVPPAATSGASNPAVAHLPKSQSASLGQKETASGSPDPASTVEPTGFRPAPPGQVLLTCSSCGAYLRLLLTCGQATDVAPPIASIPATNLPRVTSTDAPTRLPATRPASGARSDRPNSLTNASLAINVVAEVHSPCGTLQMHGLSNSGNQEDVVPTVEQLDTCTEQPGPSNPCAAAPWAHQPHPTRAPTSQSHGTEPLASMPLPAARPDALLSPTTNPTADAALTAGRNQLETTFLGSPASVGPGNKRKRDDADEDPHTTTSHRDQSRPGPVDSSESPELMSRRGVPPVADVRRSRTITAMLSGFRVDMITARFPGVTLISDMAKSKQQVIGGRIYSAIAQYFFYSDMDSEMEIDLGRAADERCLEAAAQVRKILGHVTGVSINIERVCRMKIIMHPNPESLQVGGELAKMFN